MIALVKKLSEEDITRIHDTQICHANNEEHNGCRYVIDSLTNLTFMQLINGTCELCLKLKI